MCGGRIRDLKPGCAENQNSGSYPSAWFSVVSLGLSPPRGRARSPGASRPAFGTRKLSRGRGAVFLLPSFPLLSPSFPSLSLPSIRLASPRLALPRFAPPRLASPRRALRGPRFSTLLHQVEPSALPAPRLARELCAGTLQRQEVNRGPGGGEAKEPAGGDGRAAVGAGARARPAVGPAGTAVVLAAPRGGCRRLPWFFRHSSLKRLPALLEAGSSPLNPSFLFPFCGRPETGRCGEGAEGGWVGAGWEEK